MNKIDELLKIKELLDSGIISEIEFKELKKNLIQLDNNEKSTSGIIPNIITKCSNCNSTINDDETICKNCDNIDSKITSSDSISENIIPISNSTIKYIFFAIIILCLVIGLNGYYNNSNKTAIENNEIPPDSTSIVAPNEKVTNEIPNTDTLTTDEKLMMPAVQNTESQEEVDEGGDYIDSNIINRDPRAKDFANVFYDSNYTLFDLETDEPIFPNKYGVYEIWYSSNENPIVSFKSMSTSELQNFKYYKFKNEKNCTDWCNKKKQRN